MAFIRWARTKTGVVERFGKKVLPYSEPGLHYKLPWPIERLTRIKARNVRVVEIGFRSNSTSPDNEPAAYEWNVQHRSGRFQRKPEESLMLTGDQNMIELNATVHYSISRPDDFLFRQLDGDATVRAAAESVMQIDHDRDSARRHPDHRAGAPWNSGRSGICRRALDKYGAGIEVLQVKLQDVHPSLEVVDAFRDVSGAYEEKNRLINEAEGYRNEQVALARGNAKASLEAAAAYNLGRVESRRWRCRPLHRAGTGVPRRPGPNETRLYLETMEQVLPGKKKLILDSSKGRRHLFLLEDGVEIGPASAPLIAPQRRDSARTSKKMERYKKYYPAAAAAHGAPVYLRDLLSGPRNRVRADHAVRPPDRHRHRRGAPREVVLPNGHLLRPAPARLQPAPVRVSHARQEEPRH